MWGEGSGTAARGGRMGGKAASMGLREEGRGRRGACRQGKTHTRLLHHVSPSPSPGKPAGGHRWQKGKSAAQLPGGNDPTHLAREHFAPVRETQAWEQSLTHTRAVSWDPGMTVSQAPVNDPLTWLVPPLHSPLHASQVRTLTHWLI